MDSITFGGIMYTLESLEQTLNQLGKTNIIDYILTVRPLLPTLLNTLTPEDEILACTLKCMGNLKPGILVVSQDRLIFMMKMSIVKSQTDIYLKNIASFQNSTNRIPFSKTAYCDITITDNGGNRYMFTGIIESQATRIIQVLNDRVNKQTV